MQRSCLVPLSGHADADTRRPRPTPVVEPGYLGQRRRPRDAATVGPVCVPAVTLADGDLFLGGESVVSTLVDRAAQVVTVVTDDGGIRHLAEDARVVLAYRTVPALRRPDRSCRPVSGSVVPSYALAASSAAVLPMRPPAPFR